eukprot:UN4338
MTPKKNMEKTHAPDAEQTPPPHPLQIKARRFAAQAIKAKPAAKQVPTSQKPEYVSDVMGKLCISVGKDRAEIVAFKDKKRSHVCTITVANTIYHSELVHALVDLAIREPLTAADMKELNKMKLADMRA